MVRAFLAAILAQNRGTNEPIGKYFGNFFPGEGLRVERYETALSQMEEMSGGWNAIARIR